jgi:NMD protein affecting ribosome stability and mRNA decay
VVVDLLLLLLLFLVIPGLKKIKGLNKVKLIDASWVWTEPHSRRLKVKLTVQKEVRRITR